MMLISEDSSFIQINIFLQLKFHQARNFDMIDVTCLMNTGHGLKHTRRIIFFFWRKVQ